MNCTFKTGYLRYPIVKGTLSVLLAPQPLLTVTNEIVLDNFKGM